MAIKKASSVKTVKSSGVKKSAKKIIKKSLPKSGGKVLVKKITAAKKVVAPIKKALAKKKIVIKKIVTPKKTAVATKTTAKKTANQLLVDAAVEGILEVKGRDISILDLRGINNRVCDYYIICEADSSTQVNAIAGSVEVMVKKRTGEKPYHTEGFQNSEWILVDYVTVVVHVFQSQIREFYNLESLWADAEVTKMY